MHNNSNKYLMQKCWHTLPQSTPLWALVHFHNLCTPRDNGAEITAGSWRWLPFSVRFINFNWKLRHNKWKGGGRGRGVESVGVKDRESERLKYNQKYAQLNAKNMRNTQIQRMTYGYDKHLPNTLPPPPKGNSKPIELKPLQLILNPSINQKFRHKKFISLSSGLG